MRRFLPDTIAGRTLVALVVGLLLSHLTSMAIYYGDREIALELVGGEHIGERIVTVSRLVENASPAERARLVALASNPKLGVTLGRQAEIEDDAAAGWRTEVLRRALAAHFGAGREPNFRIHYATSGNAGEETKAGDGPPDGKTLLVAVRLTDGDWLNFAAPIEPAESLWSLRFVLSVAVTIAIVVILSAFVVFHLTAPLRTFALAARRLGRDVAAPPLPERGPQEVRQAVRAFNDMQDRVRRFVEDRTQMVAAISHDLQTPITRMRLRAEFIEDAEQRDKLLADLEGMERMVAATLSFARDDAAAEARETVDLVALVQRVCDDLTDAGLAVEFDGTGRLAYACRPTALRRALANLIENAAKYGERARVALLPADDRLVVRIDDDGAGIPEDRQEAVFKPFVRLEESRSRETGGTGLGLTVARSVVRAHGGDIALRNRPEGGLRVEARLPR
ncbi:MAG: ATP-binding protein [Dongiaceae bacterium]